MNAWANKIIRRGAQNLIDMMSNQLTPTLFAKKTSEFSYPCGVALEVENKDWKG